MGHKSPISYQNLSSLALPEGTYIVRAVAGPDMVHSDVHNLILQNIHANLLFFRLPTYSQTAETLPQHPTQQAQGQGRLSPCTHLQPHSQRLCLRAMYRRMALLWVSL